MRSLLVFGIATTSLFVSVVACSADPAESTREDDEGDAPRETGSSGRGARADGGDATGETGGAEPSGEVCERELELYQACGLTAMNCGADGYVGWCQENDAIVESEQRIAGRLRCTDENAHCEPSARVECIYNSYNDSQLSTAQQDLLTRYCAACEPGAAAACESRTKTYAGSSDSLFLAVWELSEALVTAIAGECIDAAAAAGCAEHFDRCAGGLYVDALVGECPE